MVRAITAAAVALVIGAGSAQAATFTATRTDDPVPGPCDPADCSLREAILAANAGSGGDTVALPPGHYRLTVAGAAENASATGDLDVTKSTTVKGAGARSTTVDGNGIDRVFELADGTSISDMTITGGLVDGSGAGIQGGNTLVVER